MSQNAMNRVNDFFNKLEKFVPTSKKNELYDALCTLFAEVL